MPRFPVPPSPAPAGLNLQSLRGRNRAALLRLLAAGRADSQAELAERTGLSRMTVSTILRGLREDGLLEEEPAARGAAPRPAGGRMPRRLSLAPGRLALLGLYLSRDGMALLSADLSGAVLDRRFLSFPPRPDREAFRSLLSNLVRDGMAPFGRSGSPRPLGIGIASIGPLDRQAGILLDPPDFYGLADLPIADWVRSESGLAVRADNDMNAAVLAESLFGAARDHGTVLYLGITHGIGAGFLSGGRLFTGASGFAGEAGHMILDPSGPPCPCGRRGCLEVVASVPVLLRETGADSWDGLLDGARRGDALAAGRIRLLRSHLAEALADLANLLDPELVLLGHEGAQAADLLLPELEEAVNAAMLQHGIKRIPIRPAALGADAPLWGGVALVLEQWLRTGATLPDAGD